MIPPADLNHLIGGDLKLIQEALAFYHTSLRDDQAESDFGGYTATYLNDKIDDLEGLQYRLPFLEVNVCSPSHPDHMDPDAGFCCGRDTCLHECCRDTRYDRYQETNGAEKYEQYFTYDPFEDARER